MVLITDTMKLFPEFHLAVLFNQNQARLIQNYNNYKKNPKKKSKVINYTNILEINSTLHYKAGLRTLTIRSI